MMRVRFKGGLIILGAESADERAAIAHHVEIAAGHVFRFVAKGSKGFSLCDLGPAEEACREPINIVYGHVEDRWRPISNLAETPFELHNRRYASIEGFWQGLKFDEREDRERIAALHGLEAKKAGTSAPARDIVVYRGAAIPVGRPEHWALMAQACAAKFMQNADARTALLATGNRPLTHHMRRDSRTIPGAVMADIWMRVRGRLRRRATDPRSKRHPFLPQT